MPKPKYIGILLILAAIALGGYSMWRENTKAAVTINSNKNYSMTDGLVLYYTMDGNDINWTTGFITDQSSTGAAGEIWTGLSKTSSPRTGKIGQALNFGYDREDIGIKAGNPVAHQSLMRSSVCSWVYPLSYGGSFWDSNIIGRMDGIDPDAEFYFQFADDAGDTLYYSHHGSVSPFTWYVDTSPLLNTWSYVCVTYDASSRLNDPIFYVNGAAVASTNVFRPAGSPDFVAGAETTVGNLNVNSGSFDGMLDDVRMYNRILSPAEVKQLYHHGTSATSNSSKKYSLADGLLGYWTFDGPDMIQNVRDVSGNGNHATLTNFTSTTTVPGRVGQALRFSGSNQRALSSINLSSTNKLSIAFWLNLANGGVELDDTVLAYQTGGTNYDFLIIPQATAPPCTQGNMHIVISGDVGANEKCYNGANTGVWHHYLLELDKTQSGTDEIVGFYVDGVLQTPIWASGSSNNTGNFNARTLHLMDWNSSYYTDGVMDDLRIYNRLLSSEEAMKLYTLGSGRVGYQITLGDDTIGTIDDSGNSGNIFVQQATTSLPGRIETVSFYIGEANGNLRLGVYDATGANMTPGNLLAQTDSFTPVLGWNTARVRTPVNVPAGTYWVGYAPSSDLLHFLKTAGARGVYCYDVQAFGDWPASFSSGGCGATTWSLYATLFGGANTSGSISASKKNDMTDGLVGYWTFDGPDMISNVRDVSGNGNHGIFNSMSTSTIAGVIGQALTFSSSTAADVDAGAGLSLNLTGEMSVFAWVKPSRVFGGNDYGDYVVAQCNPSNGADGQFELILGRNGNNRFTVGWGGGVFVDTVPNNIDPNEWYHVGFVRTGSTGSWTAAIYLNGALNNSASGIVTDPASQQPNTMLGECSRVDNDNFVGDMDDVRIYNRALSAAEIKQLYNMGK